MLRINNLIPSKTNSPKRIIFIWEIALALASLFPTVNTIFNFQFAFSHSTFIFCMLLIFYNKFRLEGFRSSTILLIFGIIIACLPYKYCSLLGSIPLMICAFFIKSYYLPMDANQYKIGYQLINFPYKNKKDIISVYYPTKETTKPTKYLPLPITYYSQKLTDTMKYVTKLPRFFPIKIILYLQYHFQKILKLDVQYNSTILPSTELNFSQNKYQIIIFSHGLGGFQDQLSSFLSNLVGKLGYILICPMHNDELIDSKKKIQKDLQLKENWEEDIEKRYNQIKEILDAIYDDNSKNNFICQTLDAKKSEINFEKISIAGFSYGGGTAIYTTLREPQRIKGVCIALDPWIYPIKSDYLEKELMIPTLILRTNSFVKPLERISKFIKNQAFLRSKNLIQCCYFKYSTHTIFCNEVFLSQTENFLARAIKNQYSVFPLHTQMKFFIELFLQNTAQYYKTFKQINNQFQTQNLHSENWLIVDEIE